MVSKASELLPDPDTPLITVSLPWGISQERFFRLCVRALRMMMASFNEKAPVNCSGSATVLSASFRAQPCILYYKLRRKPVPDGNNVHHDAHLVFRRCVVGRVGDCLGFQNGYLHKKELLHSEEIWVVMTKTPSWLETICNGAEAIREFWGSHSTHRRSK